MKPIQILSVMSELGAGTRGASLGMQALWVACLNKKSSFLKDFEIKHIEVENDRLIEESDTPYAKQIVGINNIFDKTASALKDVYGNGNFPLLISGDHSVAGGTIKGIKEANPNKRLGVIWIDAHGDLHTPYTTPSGNVHGMPLATALKIDNLESQINPVDKNTIALWNQLCGDSPRILVEDLVLFGVRDTEIPEDELIERLSIKNYTVEEVRSRSAKSCAIEALERLKNCDIIYISFDVDSMDSMISNGTGTPVLNGFTQVEIEKILHFLLKDNRISCFEMVEINPTLDEKGNKMAEVSFDILEFVIKSLKNKAQ